MKLTVTQNFFQTKLRPVTNAGANEPARLSQQITDIGLDTFEYQTDSPSFTSVNLEMAALRKYANELGDAYSSGKMIKQETFEYIMKKVSSMRPDAAIAKFVQKYSKLMDKYERKILNFYAANLRASKSATFQSVTAEQFPKSASRLQPMYIRVVSQLEVLVNSLPDTKMSKRLTATIQAWKEDLRNGNWDDAMVKEKYQTIIEKMKFPKQHKETRKNILNVIDTLPSASDNFDAFIVKYKDATKRVILKRLLQPFTVSIEHLEAKGNGGHANAIGNCVLVRTKDNNARGTEDVIKNHPERIEALRNYFIRVVNKCNNGGMKEIPFYPFEVKQTIEKVTHHKLNLDKELANLKMTKEEAYRGFIV